LSIAPPALVLGPLGRNDSTAQPLQVGILQFVFLAHQECARMVRNHRFQKLPVIDGDLLPDAQPEPDQRNHADEHEPGIQFLVLVHATHHQ